jgi:hypothetical protein
MPIGTLRLEARVDVTLPVQVGIVTLHARLPATHALNGLADTDWDRASKARIGSLWPAERRHELSS